MIYNDISVLEVSCTNNNIDRNINELSLQNFHLARTFAVLREECKGGAADILSNLTTGELSGFRRLLIKAVIATDLANHFKVLSKFSNKAKGPATLKKNQEGDRVLLLEMLLHTADISNPAKPFLLSKKWADKVTEEFYAQVRSSCL